MTIFTDLNCFTGRDATRDLRKSFTELLDQIKLLKLELGEHAYLMDCYFSCILEATSKLREFTTISNGLDDAMELRGICRSIISGSGHYSEHPFYIHAQNYINAMTCQFHEDSTKEAYCVIELFHDYLEYKVNLFIRQQEQVLYSDSDIPKIKEMFYKICDILGDTEQMMNINRLFCQRFFTVTPTDGFIQGLTSDLIYSMIERDMESSWQVFQFILDQKD